MSADGDVVMFVNYHTKVANPPASSCPHIVYSGRCLAQFQNLSALEFRLCLLVALEIHVGL